MRHSVRENWTDSLVFIVRNPIVLFPFVVFAFLQGIALELLYFSSRKPLSFAALPLIRKFFGEAFAHYPGFLLLLPRLFYFAEITLYVFAGAFLAAVTVNIYKNIKNSRPVSANALLKNTAKRYGSLFSYGVIFVVFIFLLRNVDTFILTKAFRWSAHIAPNLTATLAPHLRTLFLYLTNIVMLVFLVLTVPIIAIKNRVFYKALPESLYLGLRNFFYLFAIVFVPFLVYLPVFLLKSYSLTITNITFPEINIYITAAGIVVSMLVDCYITVCVSRFLLDREGLR